MSDGLNRVMLLGHLGADPDLRVTGGGQSVLNLRLATAESYLDKNKVRQERTDWHNVAVWGKRGEALSRLLSKGSKLFVEGSLRTSSYEDRDGNKRYRTDVIARNVILCGGRDGGQPRGEQQAEAKPTTTGSSGGGFDDADYGGDDEIPFAHWSPKEQAL